MVLKGILKLVDVPISPKFKYPQGSKTGFELFINFMLSNLLKSFFIFLRFYLYPKIPNRKNIFRTGFIIFNLDIHQRRITAFRSHTSVFSYLSFCLRLDVRFVLLFLYKYIFCNFTFYPPYTLFHFLLHLCVFSSVPFSDFLSYTHPSSLTYCAL